MMPLREVNKLPAMVTPKKMFKTLKKKNFLAAALSYKSFEQIPYYFESFKSRSRSTRMKARRTS